MVDRRQLLRAIVLGAGGATLAACGVPGSSKPIIDGPGPSGGVTGELPANDKAPSPNGINDPEAFVRTFLMAVAGQPDDASLANAVRNARSFMTATAAAEWQPDIKQQITVVRIGEPTLLTGAGGQNVVAVELTPVGVLTGSGLVKSQVGHTTTAKFSVVTDTDTTTSTALRIGSGLPPELLNSLLLSSEGLANYYTAQLIYYWDTEGRGLVPDLRYLPRVGINRDQWPTQIVNWVVTPPTEWVQSAVTWLPVGTSLNGLNVVRQNGAFQVLLTPPQGFDPQKIDSQKVVDQLRWSLRPTFLDPVHLQVNNQPKTVDEARFVTVNLADSPFRAAGDPPAFFVAGGQARPVRSTDPLPPVLNSPENSGVVSAALSRDLKQAALVRAAGGGRYDLWLGRLSDANPFTPIYQAAGLSGAHSMSRPVFLVRPDRVLVVADGALLTVGAGGPQPVSAASAVNVFTAFAVAPDGRRIAVIADGQLAVAAIIITHGSDAIGLGTFNPIDAGGLVPSSLSAVAWTRLERLAVAGQRPDGSYGLTEVSIDGATQLPLFDGKFDNPITQLVSYPPLPIQTTSTSGPVMVQTRSSGAYLIYGGGKGPALEFRPPEPSPKPSASAAPVAPVPASAPFYFD